VTDAHHFGPEPGLFTPCFHTEFDTTGGGQLIMARELVLYGWSIVNESTTLEAEVDFYDGLQVEGVPAWPVTLLPQESSREVWMPQGILCQVGLFAAAAIGTVKGSVFWLPPAR